MARLLLIGLVMLLLPGMVLAQVCLVPPPLVAPAASFYPAPVVALRPVPVVSYYAPAVVSYYAPAVVPPPPAISAPVFACPVPVQPPAAPPPSEPRRKPAVVPSVSEFRDTPRFARSPALETSFYRAYYLDPNGAPRSVDQVTLKLTNASGKSVLVWVNGVRFLLLDGQSIQREVGREFTWQVEGRERETGRAPAGQQGMSIVIDR